MKIKLCGFSEITSLKAAIDCEIDFVGFVFYEKSPRNISFEKAAELSAAVPLGIAKVAVVLDSGIDFLQKIDDALNPQYFQLHGNYDIEKIKEIKAKFPQVKLIKAFNIKSSDDFNEVNKFSEFVDFFLFDNKIAGSGEAFDWKLLSDFQSEKDWFLSGGLNAQNIRQAVEISGAKMVDVSSGIEEERGKKSISKIIEFVKILRAN